MNCKLNYLVSSLFSSFVRFSRFGNGPRGALIAVALSDVLLEDVLHAVVLLGDLGLGLLRLVLE